MNPNPIINKIVFITAVSGGIACIAIAGWMQFRHDNFPSSFGVTNCSYEIEELKKMHREGDNIFVAILKTQNDHETYIQDMFNSFDCYPQFNINYVTPEQIVEGVLSKYQAVIFPGGSGQQQAALLGEFGKEQVRKFIHSGGIFVGICAGAYFLPALEDCHGNGITGSFIRRNVKERDIQTFLIEKMQVERKVDIVLNLECVVTRPTIPQDAFVDYGGGPIWQINNILKTDNDNVLAYYNLSSMKDMTEPVPAILTCPYGVGDVLLSSPEFSRNSPSEFIIAKWLIEASRKVSTPSLKDTRVSSRAFAFSL